VTGKDLEDIFPNSEEINLTFDKLNGMIEVSNYN
jgi:hypothetical protein